MSGTMPRVLVVDDDDGHRKMLLAVLRDWKYLPEAAVNGEEAVAKCKEFPFDGVVMDIRMPGLSGIEALKKIKERNPAIPVLIMTAYSNVETAVEAIKSGAYDYITKPLDFDKLQITLKNMLEYTSLVEVNRQLRRSLADTVENGNIVGQSPAMRRLLDMVSAIAPSEATVLITGESGTGKELIARLIHSRSNRQNGPFVPVNCGALTESLLESELFGHEKGAFTGADKARDGRFMSANGGTIFLDEIGEMPLGMQVKLLRVLQEREVQRLGSDVVTPVDVRIVAATNKDLLALVADGAFREDLYYRLHVVTLTPPPLRDRLEDIPQLVQHFIDRFAAKNAKQVKGITPGALDLLMKYTWPGNIRELENCIERAVVLLMGHYISERELPDHIVNFKSQQDATDARSSATATLEDLEHQAIIHALEQSKGNKSEAARNLGISRKTLHLKLQRFNL